MTKKRPNILLITTDEHRADYIGCLPNSTVDTPNLNRLAAEGTVFTNCVTVNPVCLPARTALLTGKYTHQIGTLGQGGGDLSRQHPTYPRALQKAGYHTAAVGKMHLLWGYPGCYSERGSGHNLHALNDELKKFGFNYLWEASGKQLAIRNHCDYCHYLNEHGLLETYRDHAEMPLNKVSISWKTRNKGKLWNWKNSRPFPLEEKHYVDIVTADKAIEQIRNRPEDKPLFLFTSFCSPHMPFDPPQRYLDMTQHDDHERYLGYEPIAEEREAGAEARRAYRAMIRLVDDQIGRILTSLSQEGILDDTVIMFTADHGEMLGDHNLVGKGFPYFGSVNVPAIIRHPDYLFPKENSSPIELIDFTATILDLAGCDVRKSLSMLHPKFHNIIPCRSFMPLVEGKTERIRDYAFSEFYGWNTEGLSAWRMVQNEEWKYFKEWGWGEDGGPAHEVLWNIKDDPAETVNRATDSSCAPMLQQMRSYVDDLMDRTPPAQLCWAPYDGDDEIIQ